MIGPPVVPLDPWPQGRASVLDLAIARGIAASGVLHAREHRRRTGHTGAMADAWVGANPPRAQPLRAIVDPHGCAGRRTGPALAAPARGR